MAKEFSVSVQIIRTYSITVAAESAEEAETKVNGMDAADISAQGSLKAVDVDYVEVQ
jgi:hypothetical protein